MVDKMKDTIERLREWGCDMDGAMERFLNDEDLYRDCLNAVIEDEAFDGLKTALDAHNAQEAFGYAHTLKGVAANLGIEVLLEKLLPVVEILRGGSFDGVEQWMPELEQRYEQVIQSIKQCEE